MSGPAPDVNVEVSVVVLTRGDRPAALEAALTSIARQRDVTVETIVVWNGAEPAAVDAGRSPSPTRSDIVLPENVGIAAGRNIGAAQATGSTLFFLDDDAEITDDDVLARALAMFAAQPRLAVVSCRIVDDSGATAQRHVPRLGRSRVDESGAVTSFLGGVSFVRTSAFREVGGLPDAFFYAMEETDLSWRLVDADWSLWYAADLVIRHPRTDPSRHADSTRITARNRVWMAHRLLPAPLAVLYVVDWTAIVTARQLVAVVRRRGAGAAHVRAVLAGTRDGWRTRVGPRRPIRWRTVWQLSRLGRPPVI